MAFFPERFVTDHQFVPDLFDRLAEIDDEKNDIREEDAFERRAECVDHKMRQIFDEADRIRQKDPSVMNGNSPRLRDERRKEHVLLFNAFIRQRVEKRAFSGVRVTGERDDGKALFVTVGAPGIFFSVRFFEFALNACDPALHVVFIGIFVITETAETGLFILLGKRYEHFRARQFISQTGELDLELCSVRRRPFRENIENEIETVDHAAFRTGFMTELCDVVDLTRRQRIVEYDDIRPRSGGHDRKLFRFS